MYIETKSIINQTYLRDLLFQHTLFPYFLLFDHSFLGILTEVRIIANVKVE